jgi:DNA-binding NarL/FixJ family response regulator
MSSLPRVLVLDSHPVMREGVAMLLAGAMECAVCAEGGGFPGAAGRILKERIDLVIADFSIHGQTALPFLETLGKSPGRTRCLIFSSFDELRIGYPCMRAGASGFVSKSAPTDRLVAAAKTVLEGRQYVSEMLAKMLMGKEASAVKSSVGALLSSRELEVFTMLGGGMVVSHIAIRLGISVKTVEAHRENIKNKLGCGNSSQVVAAAARWLDDTVVAI